MEDNLTKVKRALMAPKQLCPSGLNLRAIEPNRREGYVNTVEAERDYDQEDQGVPYVQT